MQEITNTNEQMQCVVPCENLGNTPENSVENTTEGISYGKFKSADTLYEAYCELEKEFTKKCQKVNELSKANDYDIDQRVKDCIRVNPKLQDYADKIADIYAEGGVAEVNLAKMLNGMINAPVDIINDAKFLDEYVYNNVEIKNNIISAYLEEKAQNKLPKCLTNRGKTLLTPVARPKSLAEAGRIAQDILENRRI